MHVAFRKIKISLSFKFLPCLLKIEHLTVSAAILCPVVCISDVMNKAGISLCVKIIEYATSQPFPALHY